MHQAWDDDRERTSTLSRGAALRPMDTFRGGTGGRDRGGDRNGDRALSVLRDPLSGPRRPEPGEPGESLYLIRHESAEVYHGPRGLHSAVEGPFSYPIKHHKCYTYLYKYRLFISFFDSSHR